MPSMQISLMILKIFTTTIWLQSTQQQSDIIRIFRFLRPYAPSTPRFKSDNDVVTVKTQKTMERVLALPYRGGIGLGRFETRKR